MKMWMTRSRKSNQEKLSTMKDRLFSLLVVFIALFLLAACQSENLTPQAIMETELMATVATAPPTQTPTTTPVDRSQYEEVFDIVWGTVNEMYFDPTFNGVDWESVRDLYRPKILAAKDDEVFYLLLNEMCFELGVSHITPWLYTLPIPVAVLAVTTITTASTLSKLDPVSIIERRL